MWTCILDYLKTYSDVITAISAALLTLVTGGLVWLGFSQGSTTRQQLRAYLGVDETPDSPGRQINFASTDKGRVLETHALLKNYGATPAYDVQVAMGIVLIRGKMTDEYFEGAKYTHSHTLQPGDQSYLVVHSEPGISDATLQQYKYKKDGFRAYVYGIVKYKDTFKKRHFTRFCIHVDYRNGPKGTPGWDLYEKYNESD